MFPQMQAMDALDGSHSDRAGENAPVAVTFRNDLGGRTIGDRAQGKGGLMGWTTLHVNGDGCQCNFSSK